MKKLLNILEEIYKVLEENEDLLEEEKANLANAFFHIERGFKYFLKLDRKYGYGIDINDIASIKECINPSQVFVLRQFVEDKHLYEHSFGEIYEMVGENPDGFIRLFKDLLKITRERQIWDIVAEDLKAAARNTSAMENFKQRLVSTIYG